MENVHGLNIVKTYCLKLVVYTFTDDIIVLSGENTSFIFSV